MTWERLLFGLIAVLSIGSALGVLIARSVVYAAIWLIFFLFATSLLFFLLGADFLGAVHLIVYVGGTMVLLIFGVMLTSHGPFQWPDSTPKDWLYAVGIASCLFLGLSFLAQDLSDSNQSPGDEINVSTATLGLSFLGVSKQKHAYLLPFEILSVHLLVVLIAAAYMARARQREGEKAHD
jgi:NADH-quinone oxidoreductase subunit J